MANSYHLAGILKFLTSNLIYRCYIISLQINFLNLKARILTFKFSFAICSFIIIFLSLFF